MEFQKYYPQHETFGVVVAIGEKCYAVEEKVNLNTSRYINYKNIYVNPCELVTCGQEILMCNKY